MNKVKPPKWFRLSMGPKFRPVRYKKWWENFQNYCDQNGVAYTLKAFEDLLKNPTEDTKAMVGFARANRCFYSKDFWDKLREENE